MTREIKFRAWDKIRKQLEPQFEKTVAAEDGTEYVFLAFRFIGGSDWSNPIVTLATALAHPDRYVVMQFTGLHDKNGKEIYESDYLQWGYEVMCVYWGSGKYVLQNISTGDIIDCNENTTSVREIIGNRFETPREHPAMATDL